MGEDQRIQAVFNELHAQQDGLCPEPGKPLKAPREPAVYVIHRREAILYVGKILRARGGLHQRPRNHLHDSLSFTAKHLKRSGATLHDNGHTCQFLIVKDFRQRALLEAYAVGSLCPRHTGLED
jgi:hypothetical protein